MANRETNGKSLGQDPFADLDDLDFEAIDAAASKPVPNWLKAAQGGDKKPAPPPKAQRKPPIESKRHEPKSRFEVTVESKDMPETSEAKVVPTLEPEVAVDPEIPEMVAAPDQTDDHLLDDLISTIDEEIDRTFGAEVASGFVAQRRQQQTARQAQYVIFRLAGTDYAAPAANIKEVGEVTNQTRVPNVPAWLLGVTNLRGDIVSLVDLRTFLDLEEQDYEDVIWQTDGLMGVEQEMLIAQIGGASPIMVGLLVDVVSDIRYLTLDKIEKPRAPIEDKVAPYLQGVYEDKDEEKDEFLVILDFEKLLRSPEMSQFETTKQF